MSVQIHLNKTGTATMTPDGTASDFQWSVDNPSIYTATPQGDGHTALIQPLAIGSSNIVGSCSNGQQTISGSETIEIINAPASAVVVSVVENP